MNEITIVCCYNDLSQFNTLQESLDKQTESFELVSINNINKQYSSCSKAFNDSLKRIKTKYVIFLHQDIIFEEKDTLAHFKLYMDKITEYDIVGVAGARKDGSVYTNIKHGKNNTYAGKNRVNGIMECQTLDECFFGGYTKCFVENPFDEEICDNWHLYCVERCLNALTNNNKVYVVDINLIHNSTGKINHYYNRHFYNMSKKYASKIDYISTTCAKASTKFPAREIAFLKRKISLMLNRY